MKVNCIEIKDNELETVNDMIKALLEVPKGYLLHPLGQKCKMAIDNYHKCVYLDDPNWINEYELKEDIGQNNDDIITEISKEELEKYTLYYIWYSKDETDGIYEYYSNEEDAKYAFDNCCNNEKTYGAASFINGKLKPNKVLESTL